MMFRVVMKAGSVSSEMYSNLSYKEAVEQELDRAGVHINYRGRGFTAYARLRK